MRAHVHINNIDGHSWCRYISAYDLQYAIIHYTDNIISLNQCCLAESPSKYRQPVCHWKPRILWKWAESEGACFVWGAVWPLMHQLSDFCYNLFAIEWSSMWSHSTIPWRQLKPMAPWERNFGSANKTLEAPTKHWKIFLNKHIQQWQGMTTVLQWLRASVDRVTT